MSVSVKYRYNGHDRGLFTAACRMAGTQVETAETWGLEEGRKRVAPVPTCKAIRPVVLVNKEVDTHPEGCFWDTSHWQMVHFQTCCVFRGISGTKQKVNHCFSLAANTEAGSECKGQR